MGDESVYTGWMYRGRRPPSDSAYFENMSRCVFQSGLNWATIASRWPAFRGAFEGFDIAKVAGYGAEDIARLMGDARIIRNRRKILATIHNAREFERIIHESGGVAAWLDGLDKSNNYQGVIKRVLQRFKHVGATSVPLWLYSVGEDIDVSTLVESRFGKE
ncbi:MAG: DNA-3-methyladenine glycosylase I [Candidatus Bathyarchaeota archaeon]|nr:DNA-3-methyladenine glycosylase I [Candidatus Bathyarchaeota archaeon]